jgi:ElaB/YqjD/DUF883 family membrane-anchored ribosome-binding protein
MPPETDLIKQQMSQTRAALTEKLQTLENKVIAAIASTTDMVARTVQDVGTTVRETSQNFRSTMRDTVSSVRDAFDVSRQIHQHPWLMLGGSVLAGYVCGVVLDNLEHGRLPSLPAAEQLFPHSSEVRQRMTAGQPSARRIPGFLKALADTFAPELDKLKSAAVRMAMTALRDKIGDSVPPHLRSDFTEMMDRITAKLDGHSHPPGAMYGASEEYEETNGARESRPMGMA